MTAPPFCPTMRPTLGVCTSTRARTPTPERRSQRALHHHLLEVASLVAESTEGKGPNLVIAALLHDAIEDCEVPPELIAKAFDSDIADLVAEVTDDKTLDKKERKRRQVENAHKKTDRAKAICGHSPPVHHQIGPCGAEWNTSIGLVRLRRACAESMSRSKNSSMRRLVRRSNP